MGHRRDPPRGAGTLREKADVLRLLYERAGFAAEVVLGQVPPELATATPESIFVAPARIADPTVDPDDLARWRDRAGLGPTPNTFVRFDAGGDTSAALAEEIGQLLPPRAGEATGAPWPVSNLPMVRVRIDGTDTYALPVHGAELTEQLTTEATSAPPAGPAPVVRITLSMTSTAAPSDVVELVTNEWSAEEVVGRQVVAQLVPPVTLEERLALAAGDVHLVVATLSLRRPGDDIETIEQNLVTGRAITITGAVVEDSDDGLRVGGVDVAPAASDVDTAAVASLAVDVDPLSFPSINLRISALDASGAPVDGLPASSFAVTEDGAPVAAFATRNTAPPPRILLIVDSSLSVDPAYTSPEGRTALATSFAPALLRVAPKAEVQIIGTGSQRARPDAWVPLDAAALQAELLLATPVGSAVWTAVEGAEPAHPAVIVLLSDGVADETDPGQLAALRAAAARGAPVVVAGIGTVDAATLDAIAELSHGTRVAITGPGDTAPIVEAVSSLLDGAAAAPYRLAYDAPGDEPGRRTVVVSVGDVSAEVTYTAPDEAARTAPPGLQGLYLTVAVGTDPPVDAAPRGPAPGPRRGARPRCAHGGGRRRSPRPVRHGRRVVRGSGPIAHDVARRRADRSARRQGVVGGGREGRPRRDA